MSRPVQDVRIHDVQSRKADPRIKRPYLVRRKVDGVQRSSSFATKAEAERYRRALLDARLAGQEFDEATGEPIAWQPQLADLPLHEWARRWVAPHWPEWAPRTRASVAEALVRLTLLALPGQAVEDGDLRRYLLATLPPDGHSLIDAVREDELAKRSLTLDDLTPVRMAPIASALTTRLDGSPMAASTANRYRTTAHACLRAAFEAGAIPADPWPARTRAQGRRKSARLRSAVDTRRLPNPRQMATAIDAITNSNPGSRAYRVMTAVAYYGGLRPSEVVMLRPRALHLPSTGWGVIDVVEADISDDEPGEPKTGPRSVPIPPTLVAILRDWLDELGPMSPGDLLFRTQNGTKPSQSNWGRAWRRAMTSVGLSPIRVYDCRHAAATTWLRAGVPLGETARRLGHSVDTLVTTYVGALEGDQALGNSRIEAELARVD